MTPTAQPPADEDKAAREIARELKHALADNAYPAADGTADIDNDAIDLIAITLRAYAEQCVSAALRQHGASVSAWRFDMEAAPRDRFILLFCREDGSTWWAKWQGDEWHGVDEHGLTRSGHHTAVTGWRPIGWQPLPPPPDQFERETEAG